MHQKKIYHFKISERKLLLRLLDVGLPLLGLYLISNYFNFDYFNFEKKNWRWSVLLTFYILFFGEIFENYDLQKSNQFFKILKSIVISTSIVFLVYILTPFITPELPESRLQILYFYITIILAMAMGRLLYIGLIDSPKFKKSVLVIANGNIITEIADGLTKADANYQIKYYLNTTKSKKSPKTNIKELFENNLLKVVQQEGIHEIVVTRNSKFSSSKLYNDLLTLFNLGYIIKDYSEVYEELTGKVFVSFIDTELYKQFPFSKYNNKPLYLATQRIFDVLISSVGLFVFAILLPLIFILNLIANKGPLFYKQKRVGKKGKTFVIYKLRSMVINAEKNGAVWAKKNDIRITKFGKFLRKSRLDEFPQFYNILKGNMSVIGPRPERPFFVTQLANEISFYPTRHIVKPGLTGWAQVNTEYASTLKGNLEKLQYDLFYIKHQNVFLDFNIMIKTLSTVLFFRGQ